MARRYEDWLAQARKDLKSAQDSEAAGNYEWACFQAQQSAEKAVKALLRYHNQETTGHTLVHLLREAKAFATVPEDVPPLARELDRHYIAPRYPNSFASGHPAEYYDAETAARCLDYAHRFLDFIEANLP